MANYEGIELIVRYDGSKASFENVKAQYAGRLVLVTGSQATNATAVEKQQAIWVSAENDTIGKYIDVANIGTIAQQLDYLKAIRINGKDYTAKGAIVELAASGGLQVGIDEASGIVTFSGESLNAAISGVSGSVNTLRQTVTDNTSDIATLVGSYSGDDTKSARTIAIEVGDGVKRDIVGDPSDNFTQNQTLYSLVNMLNMGIADSEVKVVQEGDKYYIYQGAQGLEELIGTINIPKALVFDSGDVVNGSWNGDTFTEDESGPDKAIKLVFLGQEDRPIYINVEELIDAYTAEKNAKQVQVAISKTNEISATIVAKSITSTQLSDAVNASLVKADTAMQRATFTTKDYIYGKEVSVNKQEPTFELSTKTATINNAMSNADLDGLVTARDLADYLKARFAVKVVAV